MKSFDKFSKKQLLLSFCTLFILSIYGCEEEEQESVKKILTNQERVEQINTINSLVTEFESSHQILKRHINLSGKQRMLSQKMTKLSMFLYLEIDREENTKELLTSAQLFDKTLVEFKLVDDEKIKHDIVEVKKVWQPFYQNIQGIIKYPDEGKYINYIIEHNEELLKLSNQLVESYVASNKDENYLDKYKFEIVNIAGKLRFTSQKITKEKLLVEKFGLMQYEPKIDESIALFESSLSTIQKGNEAIGIPKASDKEIKEQLKIVENLWMELKPIYNKTPLSSEDFKILKKNKLLLQEADKAVSLIENKAEF